MSRLDNITAVSLLAGTLEVNTRFTALQFYQGQKGAPLTPEEIKEVNDEVMQSIGNTVVTLSRMLASAVTDEPDSCGCCS